MLTYRIAGALPVVVEEGHLWGFLFWIRDSGLNGQELDDKEKGTGPEKAAAQAKADSFDADTHAVKTEKFRTNSPYTVNPWESPGLASVEFVSWEKA